ncbi:MAG: polysaccharide biosynthesis/export family protein [Verrucomicrobiota bacterium]
MKRLFQLFTVLLVFCAARTSMAQALRPGDSIEIRLSGVPVDEIQQFSAPYTIDETGMVNLPYIGQVKAGGMSPTQAQLVIEAKLKDDKIYTHPTVTIAIQGGSRFVSVGGAVKAPGRIAYTVDLTLMSAINAAGGFNDFANPKKVHWVHDGKSTDLDTRKFRKDPSLDPKVAPGDQIEVPQSIW